MSVNSKMTALADEIRELSGTSEALGLDAMANHISETNTEVATQADLIAQIQVAVNSLPEVSSGNVETCIVTLNGECPVRDIEKVFYTNGSSSIQEISFPNFNEDTSITVTKNSIIFTYEVSTFSSGSAIALNKGLQKAYFIFGDTTITSV